MTECICKVDLKTHTFYQHSDCPVHNPFSKKEDWESEFDEKFCKDGNWKGYWEEVDIYSKDVKAFIQSQIALAEERGKEVGKQELIKALPLEKDHVYRCWLENESVMFADEGKFKITKEKSNEL